MSTVRTIADYYPEVVSTARKAGNVNTLAFDAAYDLALDVVTRIVERQGTGSLSVDDCDGLVRGSLARVPQMARRSVERRNYYEAQIGADRALALQHRRDAELDRLDAREDIDDALSYLGSAAQERLERFLYEGGTVAADSAATLKLLLGGYDRGI